MRGAAVAAALLAAWPAGAAAQGSAYALNGMGWVGRPVSARTAGMGGSLAALDPEMGVNPAALGRWLGVAGWAVGAAGERTFAGPAGPSDNQAVRFPLLGFATSAPRGIGVGISISDFLDRSYDIRTSDTVVLNGQSEPFADASRSVGGVSDIGLGLSRRLRPTLMAGFAFHYYTGSTRLSFQRAFENAAYLDVLEASVNDYRGLGVAVGLLSAPTPTLDFGLSLRVNGRLRAENIASGVVARTRLPTQAGGGARLRLVPGVFASATVQWEGWGSSDSVAARDTWSIGAGLEVQRVTLIRLTTPLRAGYRWRQLPFPAFGDEVDERAWSIGFGFAFAQERTTLDVAVESGTRAAGPTSEKFRTAYVGLTVRP